MNQVKISSKFQVVIPKDVRELLGLEAGQNLHVIPYRSRIELVPVQDLGDMRGFLRGMETDFEREPDREL